MKTAIISKKSKVLKVGLEILLFLVFTASALSIAYLVFNLKKNSLPTKTFLTFFVSKLQTLLLSLFVTIFAFRLTWMITFAFLKNQFLSDWMSSKPYPRHYKWFDIVQKQQITINPNQQLPLVISNPQSTPVPQEQPKKVEEPKIKEKPQETKKPEVINPSTTPPQPKPKSSEEVPSNTLDKSKEMTSSPSSEENNVVAQEPQSTKEEDSSSPKDFNPFWENADDGIDYSDE
ncbi:Hypothetical protein MAU_1860 [Metamycoplasma auris 15026]|uniref:Uncharacterized protein n=1 Tax=Metamycoplasma auris 15026 TaxID=1188233 RepID=N9TSM1_9BACT|nr:hypothetical protein [Metamycoplasma auris]ENY69144.1 Hypothetical protein MAU_1860 [Metamycoplasma auris 15026]